MALLHLVLLLYLATMKHPFYLFRLLTGFPNKPQGMWSLAPKIGNKVVH